MGLPGPAPAPPALGGHPHRTYGDGPDRPTAAGRPRGCVAVCHRNGNEIQGPCAGDRCEPRGHPGHASTPLLPGGPSTAPEAAEPPKGTAETADTTHWARGNHSCRIYYYCDNSFHLVFTLPPDNLPPTDTLPTGFLLIARPSLLALLWQILEDV